jgi:cephalosporin hydroxylase
VITIIDDEAGDVTVRDGNSESRFALASGAGFEAVSRAWLKASWDSKYVYSFTWLGRPMIQLPEDMIRIQEVIHTLKPDLLIETGIAHGGSLIFYASLFEALGHGRVLGVDIDIRPPNRQAIEAHPLARRIELVQGSSTDAVIASHVARAIEPGDVVMVVLDSDHSYQHVMAEIRLYAPLVSVGSYIVVCDGIMEFLAGRPRSKPEWVTDNPNRAIADFLRSDRRFILEEPAWRFNESHVSQRVSYWPNAYLRRMS